MPGQQHRVRTAVIPAAGLGSRFRPATEAVPKELFPIVDTPALRIVADECIGAGIERLVVVSSPAKPALDAYAASLDDIETIIVYQHEPRGLGHAVACAAQVVGDEAFAVLLPDELMGGPELLQQMIAVCHTTAGSVVGLKQVPPADVGAYGVIEPVGAVDSDGVVAIRSMVEKPSPNEAPSDLIIIGRYVITPDVFAILADLPPGAKGEIQLTDALRIQAAGGPFHGVLTDIERHDTGNPLGWLTTNIELALRRPGLGDDLRAWLVAHLAATAADHG